jgi:hypothetical protein
MAPAAAVQRRCGAVRGRAGRIRLSLWLDVEQTNKQTNKQTSL